MNWKRKQVEVVYWNRLFSDLSIFAYSPKMRSWSFGRYESKITIPIQNENFAERMVFPRDRIIVSTDEGSISFIERKGLTYVRKTKDFPSSRKNYQTHLMDLNEDDSRLFFEYEEQKIRLVLRSTGEKVNSESFFFSPKKLEKKR